MNICYNIINNSETLYDKPQFYPDSARFSDTQPLPQTLQPYHSYTVIAITAEGTDEFRLQYTIHGQTGSIKLGIKKENQSFAADIQRNNITAEEDSAITWTFTIHNSEI